MAKVDGITYPTLVKNHPRLNCHGQVCFLKLNLNTSRPSSLSLCRSRRQTAETEECVKHNFSTTQSGDEQHPHLINQALAEACKFAYNDARYVNERAKNDIFCFHVASGGWMLGLAKILLFWVPDF